MASPDCAEYANFFPTDRADTFQDGEARGALSWAFIKSLKQRPNQSYLQLLNSIRNELEGKYTQKPQLSCSHPLGEWSCLSGSRAGEKERVCGCVC